MVVEAGTGKPLPSAQQQTAWAIGRAPLAEPYTKERVWRLEAEGACASAMSSSAAASTSAEVTMRRRTNEEASSREAAAAMARADGDAFLMPTAAGAVDAAAFMARYLAFRQHVELILLYVPSKTARTKPWRLTVRRAELWRDVITHFSDFSKSKVFQVSHRPASYLHTTGE